MMNSAAVHAKSHKGLSFVSETHPTEFPLFCPLWHIVDQHAFRGIGHFPWRIGSKVSFHDRFHSLFSLITGSNPRRQSPPSAPQKSWDDWMSAYPDVRTSQRNVLRLMVEGPHFISDGESDKKSQSENSSGKKVSDGKKESEHSSEVMNEGEEEEEEEGDGTDLYGGRWDTLNTAYHLSLPLSPTVLAAGVGEMEIKEAKDSYLAVLGLYSAEDEKFLRKPSRTPRDDLFDISPSLRKQLSSKIRKQVWHIRQSSVPFPLGKCVSFDTQRQCWCVDGQPWEDIRSSYSISVPIRYPTLKMTKYLNEWNLSGLIEVALWERFRDGIVVDGWTLARQVVKQFLLHYPTSAQRVFLRTNAIIRSQWTKVRMPIPALDGKLAAGELAAHAIDQEVYCFLLCLSVFIPGALAPSRSVPIFDVPTPDLLRCLKVFLGRELDEMSISTANANGIASANQHWSDLLPPKNLLAHQRDTVDDLHEKDADALRFDGVPRRSHFICLDTGTGKTRVAVTYISELFQRDLFASSIVEAVVWVSPLSALEDVIAEIKKSGVKRVCQLLNTGIPKKGYFNVVKDNVIAKYSQASEQNSLVLASSKCFFVFDEVDRCYNMTLRTSAALEFAENCYKSIAMTATPLRSNKQTPLYTWVNLGIPSYPLDPRHNGMPLACDMIKKNVDIGIRVKTEIVRVKLRGKHLEDYKEACSSYGSAMFAKLALISYTAIDQVMVEEARRHGGNDGGCLLVVRDMEHAQRLSSLFGTPPVTTDGSVFEPDTGVRVVPYNRCRGFNWAASLGHIVVSQYPGNLATYTQMVGRICRQGQPRKEVFIHKVLPAGTVVEILHERHAFVDAKSKSFEAIGRYYGPDTLLKMVNTLSD
jgi:superfamily II DNA or RNA helicase